MTEWELMTINELAEHLQLNPQTIRNWINQGDLESVKIGRARRVPREAAVRLAGGTGLEMPELLTVAQVAALLKLNQQTIRNWIDAGTLPAVYVGERRVRIKRADLDALLGSGEIVPSRSDLGLPSSGSEFWGETG